MAELNFPPGPVTGQLYTAPTGVVYQFDGSVWAVTFANIPTQQFATLGDLLYQIRVLLQDTDAGSGNYRYTTDSLVMALNQGMLEMLRMRPDIFMLNGFKAQQFSSGSLDAAIVIEEQYVPSLVYYGVGMAQMRDNEETQDARAIAFVSKFNSMLMAVS